jgi:hypothetical protein
VKRSEPDGVRPAPSKAVSGISTEQSGGEKPVSVAWLEKAKQNGCGALLDRQDFPLWTMVATE